MSTYIDHRDFGIPDGHAAPAVLHSWRAHTRRNLAQHYDAIRAAAIMAGTDPKTQIDVYRWETLGHRRSAA